MSNPFRYFNSSPEIIRLEPIPFILSRASMSKVVGAFLGVEGRHERTNSSVQARNSPLGSLAQICFEFAERHLDWIEVRRILRQVAKCRPRSLDRLPYAGNLVGCEI